MKLQPVYHEGEYVMYRSCGLCRVIGVRTECFDGQSERVYYEMHPMDQANASFFVPSDLPELDQHMRPVLSREQVENIIASAQQQRIEWVEDAKQRFDAYDAILKTGDRVQILRLIELLSCKRAELDGMRKKMYAADSRILNNARRLLVQEFAFVLEMEPEQVIPFIVEKIHEQ